MEVWKKVQKHSNYLISNKGRVKSLQRTIVYKDGRTRPCKEKILTGTKGTYGYLKVHLDGKDNVFIHRLVAEHFIDNPKKLPCVNHKDGNKQNNNIDNLEWCSYSENLIHAYNNNLNKIPKPVKQLDLNGQLIKIWKSATEAERVGGFNHRSISRCCNKQRNKYKGFKWCFE